MEKKQVIFTALLTSLVFMIGGVLTLLFGLYFLLIQKYNPMINIAILTIGIINIYLALNIYKGKNWTYYSVILYLFSAFVIASIANIEIYLKLSILIIDLLLIIFFVTSSKTKKFYKLDELDSFKDILSDSWKFTKEDSLPSWAIVISLILILMKFALFPLLTLLTGTPLPIVIVESCSMYHETEFNSWWDRNSAWYEKNSITKEEFLGYNFKNGMNKGDIILVQSSNTYNKGDVIIFSAPTAHPIIHRIVSTNPLQTKGDHNLAQIEGIETDINQSRVIGKAVFKIPLLGWIKLVFFEPFQNENNKGFCN